MNGWIKLYRKLLDWEWYSDIKTCRLFIHLMLTANREDRKWKGHIIKRGQKLTSRAKLSGETNLSERQIRTALNNLKSTNEVTIESTKKQTIITLCQFDTYQSSESQSDQVNDRKVVRQATKKRPSNEQEGKEEEEEKNTPKPPEGDDEFNIFPAGSKRKPKADQKRIKVIRNTPNMIRIGKIFGRRAETLWSVYEASALKDVDPTIKEIEAIEKRYLSKNPDKFLRQTLETLLNNWQSEIDRGSKNRGSRSLNATNAEPVGWLKCLEGMIEMNPRDQRFFDVTPRWGWDMVPEEIQQLVIDKLK